MPILLDTTVAIDCLRGRPASERVKRLWQMDEQLLVSPINIEEVVRGMRPNEEDVAVRFFSALTVVPAGKQVAWQSGLWRRAYAAKGITLSQADCLVAATAFDAGARLATGNPVHFPMPEVQVEHWPVGR
ncbi:type II toxin-antitoxin system VapC family toxin [soil metagenome]